MKISYNWLKWYLPNIPDANKIANVLTYHLTEVEGVEKNEDGDTIFDINILPNRAHDLLSHQGIARELAGQLGLDLKLPEYKIPTVTKATENNLKIEVDTDKCRRFSARIVRGIKVGPSPDWMVKHLESVGQRSINNIVDATNIVMLDCGQPSHAFDLINFENSVIKISENKNTEGEKGELKLVGRDGIVAILEDGDILIKNNKDENLSLAGIKGGINSGINENTKDILIEVANFNPSIIRKTARRIGVLSDAAKRFENDLSPELCSFGMVELSALILEMFPDAVFEEVVDYYPVKQEIKTISFTTEMVNKTLGSNITDTEIETILNNYGFKYTNSQNNSSGPRVGSPDHKELLQESVYISSSIDKGDLGKVFEITVPDFRLDLENPIDMIEEIGRIYGYDKIIPVLPNINTDQQLSFENNQHENISAIRNHFLQSGYKEVITYSFTDKGEIEILKSASDKNFLRTNITDGLKKSYDLNKINMPVLGLSEIKIFEIGSVFNKNTEEINFAWANKSGVYEKNINEFSPVLFDKKFYERKDELVNNLTIEESSVNNKFKNWSNMPFIVRDISVWVPQSIKPETLANLYIKYGSELLVNEPYLIDTFTKEDRVSYSYRLVFQSQERTLLDTEVSSIMENINKELLKIDNLELR